MTNPTEKKVLVAMSGGVDSSVAAYLIKKQGFECAGATMGLFGDADFGDAEKVAEKLDMPFYVFDFAEDFKNQVIGRFVRAYESGATPNPCIDCNRYLKFGRLFDQAKKLGMDRIATGHYARIEYDGEKKRHLLKKSIDNAKDQSYFLYSMNQEQLSCAMFPLGEFCKSEVREIAARQNFPNADRRESQDICFAQGRNYAEFIERNSEKTHDGGDFVDMGNNVIGKHKGLMRYTIGQRKGLGIAWAKPLYVRSKNASDNTITLCENDGLFEKSLRAADFNWIAYGSPPKSAVRAKAKIRHGQAEQWASAEPMSGDAVHVEFDEPQRAISKGQAVVLYDGDVVLGGGAII